MAPPKPPAVGDSVAAAAGAAMVAPLLPLDDRDPLTTLPSCFCEPALRVGRSVCSRTVLWNRLQSCAVDAMCAALLEKTGGTAKAVLRWGSWLGGELR